LGARETLSWSDACDAVRGGRERKVKGKKEKKKENEKERKHCTKSIVD